MQQTEFELSLVSSEPEGDYNPEVTLDITAYFQSSRIYDENTLTFHCDPVGSNYRSSYLRITLEDWSTVVGIRDFLADCFSDDTIDRRAMTVDVDTAITSISPINRPPTEKENLDEITIGVDGNRIEFYRSSRLHPYIHTYERKIDNVPQDHTNAEKLLSFFDKTILCHPDCELDSDDSEAADIGLLFSQNKIENTLQQIVGTDSILTTDYRKAISEFENEEYADCVRDIGRASELLIEIMLLESFNEEDLPNNMAGRINMLDKTSDGAPSFIGKTISPIWWLRNNVSHANSYNISEEEALYALSCYQIAVKKLVDYLNS